MLRFFSSPSYNFNVFISTEKDMTAEIPCAITVAMATPATPMFRTITMYKSKITFSSDEKIKRYKGIFDFPSALNTDDKILYINKNGNPIKYIFR